jgi:hypothetical protein
VRWSVEWTIEYREIAVDADKTLDLIAERPQVGRLDDPAVACPGHRAVVFFAGDMRSQFVLAEQ